MNTAELLETLQGLAEKTIRNFDSDGECKEFNAIVQAMQIITRFDNTVQADFTHRQELTGELLPAG